MRKIGVLCAAMVLSTSGCSLFMPKTQTVSATCSEPEAILQINGAVFKGNAQTEAKRNKKVEIMCTKSGFFPAQRSIDYSMSGTGVADTVGIFLLILPGIGLFSPGAWSLDETAVVIPMIPME